jgi:hypothetical protein
MSMGNALTAVATGDVTGYDNPAVLGFMTHRTGSLSAGLLSLDRSLNFVSFSLPMPPRAGLAIGIINSGVSNIDGRDIDGQPTGALTTSENSAFLSFGIRSSAGFSLGISLKILYARLYTDMTSTTAGVDIGFYMPISPMWSIGATARDIGSRYKWDTSTLYGQDAGRTSSDAFPRLYTVGTAYQLFDGTALVSADIQFSDQSTTFIRCGVEYSVIPELTLHGGIDRIDLHQTGNGIRPAAGFSLQRSLANWSPALDYAYVIEPFAPRGIHMISISARF